MFSKKGYAFWSVPLRLFVGLFWFMEGFKKLIGENNFANKNFFSIGNDSWLTSNDVKMPFAWLQTDAASGASMAAENATALSTSILSEMPSWFASIMQLMIPNATVAVFMQKMIVFIELCIGIALIIGLFTWLASVASVGFITMFVLTAMLGWNQLWVLFASLALLNGSGRVFGIDYWVMPHLQKFAVNKNWFGMANRGKKVKRTLDASI